MAIAACALVTIPLVFAGRPGPGQLLASIEVCLLVLGVAAIGGGVGWIVAAQRHWPRRWPPVATGVVIAMSLLYAWYIWFGVATRLGDWNW
jgi:hypothetical protein